jgi:hypothetical protein
LPHTTSATGLKHWPDILNEFESIILRQYDICAGERQENYILPECDNQHFAHWPFNARLNDVSRKKLADVSDPHIFGVILAKKSIPRNAPSSTYCTLFGKDLELEWNKRTPIIP